MSVVLEDDVKEMITVFKDKIKNDKTPLDSIAVILYYFKEDSQFSTNYEELHKAFFDFKDKKYLKELTFKETGLYPYSELLEKILSQLSIAGLLNCLNPVYRKFEISKDAKKRIEKSSLVKFETEERIELERISKIIQSKLIK